MSEYRSHRQENSTGWFIGIIVGLALIAIAYLVFSAETQPQGTTKPSAPVKTFTVYTDEDT